MKLPFLNPRAWSDLVANFETLQKAVTATEAFDARLDALEALDFAFSGAVQTTAWPGGSAQSSTGTVLHGLGKVPKIVLPMSQNNVGLTADPVVITFNYTPTQFQFRAQTVDNQLPAIAVLAPRFLWVAIG